MTTVLTFDIEADGLLMDATNVWCAVVNINGQIHTFKPFEDEDFIQVFSDMLAEADLIVGHNILMYDLPLLKQLYGITYNPNKVRDTLLISRVEQPDRDGGHSLGSWGSRLGKSKLDFTDFSMYSEEMLTYCTMDVEISVALYNHFASIVDMNAPYIKLEHQYAYIISLQIQSGFTLNVSEALSLHQELQKEFEEIYDYLIETMPKVKDITHYKSIKSRGLLRDETDTTYTYESRGKLAIKEFKFDTPNPTSRQQMVTYLKSLGWIPTVFTETGQAKVDESVLQGTNIEGADRIARMFRLQKMMGMIKDGASGWLKCVDPATSRVHGDVITNGANTGRATHSKPNMAQIDKKDLRMRNVWVAQKGWKLVDCDAASLESRVLGHYLAAYDGGLFADVSANGDLHTHNQELLGLNKRDSAKGILYALIYGAGDMKLGKLAMSDRGITTYSEYQQKKAGTQIRNEIADSLTGYTELVSDIKSVFNNRGYLTGLDKRSLYPRKEYSALNLLIQSAGAIIMKQATVNMYLLLNKQGYKYGRDYNLVATVHDEAVVECRADIAEDVAELMKESIRKAGRDFNFKCILDADARIGNTWAEIH
jgi:DNA polymerase-1